MDKLQQTDKRKIICFKRNIFIPITVIFQNKWKQLKILLRNWTKSNSENGWHWSVSKFILFRSLCVFAKNNFNQFNSNFDLGYIQATRRQHIVGIHFNFSDAVFFNLQENRALLLHQTDFCDISEYFCGQCWRTLVHIIVQRCRLKKRKV